VAGLPRYSKDLTIEICSGQEDTIRNDDAEGNDAERNLKYNIQKGQMIVIDLVAFAHAHPVCENITDEPLLGETSKNSSSFQFEPGMNKSRKAEHYPWGLGKRKCPAGVISVDCISFLLETLLIDQKCTWELASNKSSSHCKFGRDDIVGWMESISYQPTLHFDVPIYILISKLGDA
jgi:hypothetical protein